MKIGNIEVSGLEQVVINRSTFFEREQDTWINTQKQSSVIPCSKMANLVKHFVNMKNYKVWISGNTVNIVKEE
jgi:hypothetical protein